MVTRTQIRWIAFEPVKSLAFEQDWFHCFYPWLSSDTDGYIPLLLTPSLPKRLLVCAYASDFIIWSGLGSLESVFLSEFHCTLQFSPSSSIPVEEKSEGSTCSKTKALIIYVCINQEIERLDSFICKGGAQFSLYYEYGSSCSFGSTNKMATRYRSNGSSGSVSTSGSTILFSPTSVTGQRWI